MNRDRVRARPARVREQAFRRHDAGAWLSYAALLAVMLAIVTYRIFAELRERNSAGPVTLFAAIAIVLGVAVLLCAAKATTVVAFSDRGYSERGPFGRRQIPFEGLEARHVAVSGAALVVRAERIREARWRKPLRVPSQCAYLKPLLDAVNARVGPTADLAPERVYAKVKRRIEKRLVKERRRFRVTLFAAIPALVAMQLGLASGRDLSGLAPQFGALLMIALPFLLAPIESRRQLERLEREFRGERDEE